MQLTTGAASEPAAGFTDPQIPARTDVAGCNPRPPAGDSSQQTITRLLIDWKSGDKEALDLLTPIVYHELRRHFGSHHDRGAAHT